MVTRCNANCKNAVGELKELCVPERVDPVVGSCSQIGDRPGTVAVLRNLVVAGNTGIGCGICPCAAIDAVVACPACERTSKVTRYQRVISAATDGNFNRR